MNLVLCPIFYIWNVNEVIHNVSALLTLAGNNFLYAEKNGWQYKCTFFVTGKISNIQCGLCDRMRKIVWF